MASDVTLNEDFVDNYGRYIVIGVAGLLLLMRACCTNQTNQNNKPTQVRKWNTQHHSITQQVLKTHINITK